MARAGWSGCRAAEVLGDRAHRHELAGRSGRHLRPVVTRRQEDGRQLVLGIERSGSGAGLVPAALDQLQQPLGLERVHNTDLDLCARLLDADELADRPATGQRPPRSRSTSAVPSLAFKPSARRVGVPALGSRSGLVVEHEATFRAGAFLDP